MVKQLRKCTVCGRYTMKKDKCPVCGGDLILPYPPRFSPENKYQKYRIKLKKEKGLI